MKHIIKALAVAVFIPSLAFGVQAQNPRAAKATSRNQTTDANSSIRRSATSVIARSATLNARKQGAVVVARSATPRMGAKGVVTARSARGTTANASVARARGAISKNNKINNKPALSRASKSLARPTAVFNDITKIGGGYSNCRDAYATCMDQFCANANDTYRRCYCSDRFMEFREAYDNIDAALGMLTDFQNNNLNAVDKTAAEVDAMYSSTAGEMAIKKDTSASQKMLNEIGDILAGKKSVKGVSASSLGVLNYGDLTDTGDIWSGTGSSMFNASNADDINGLEGRALYQRAANQCAAVMKDSCSGDAMFNLASSAYSIMITQDCNTFEKNIDTKKESVIQTVKQAEKVLRDARLDEYRAHNSQDVNECLTRVEMAITNPVACGERYKRCLDYTGEYINMETGEPIYSPRLFKMMDTIAPVLGDVDVIGANAKWNELLEEKKKFVATALDTCRSLSDDVWKEFKRTAVIRIAQAQEAKIQEIKDTCVNTIRDCYNENDETLVDLTDETITDSKYDISAGRALTVRNLCYEKVLTCAALYGDPNGCTYNRSTRKIEAAAGKQCGLKALLNYVDTVDSVRIARGCETSVLARAHEMCDPPTTSTTTTTTTTTTRSAVKARANTNFVWLPNTSNIIAAPTLKATVKATPIKLNVDSKYPAGCADMKLSEIEYQLWYHAAQYCQIDKFTSEAQNSDRANINNTEGTTLNIEMARDAVRNIYVNICLGLGYPEETCRPSHVNYRVLPVLPPSLPTPGGGNNLPIITPGQLPINATDFAKMKNEIDSNSTNVGGKGVGGGKGGLALEQYWGDTNDLNAKYDTILAGANQEAGIISQVGNVVGDFALTSAAGDPIMMSAAGDPIMLQQDNVFHTSSSGSPAMTTSMGDPIMTTAAGDPIMSQSGPNTQMGASAYGGR